VRSGLSMEFAMLKILKKIWFAMFFTTWPVVGFAAGTGTGFFITDSGHFVTNFHVIQNAGLVAVRTFDGKRLQAKLVEFDEKSDLAILKVDYKSQPLALREPDKSDKGSKVFTLGYPSPTILGFKESKYAGGDFSSLIGDDRNHALFQVSIPLQPGNSGGPLISEDGAVLGVVVSKPGQLATIKSMGYFIEGVGYGIKSDYVLTLVRAANLSLKPVKSVRAVSEVDKSIVLVAALTASDLGTPQADARVAATQDTAPHGVNVARSRKSEDVTQSEAARIFSSAASLVGYEFSVVGADELEYTITQASDGWSSLRTKSGNTIETFDGLTFVYDRRSSIGVFYQNLIEKLQIDEVGQNVEAIHSRGRDSWLHQLVVKQKIDAYPTPLGPRRVIVVEHTEKGLGGNNFKEVSTFWLDAEKKIPWKREVLHLGGRKSDRSSFTVILVKSPG